MHDQETYSFLLATTLTNLTFLHPHLTSIESYLLLPMVNRGRHRVTSAGRQLRATVAELKQVESPLMHSRTSAWTTPLNPPAVRIWVSLRCTWTTSYAQFSGAHACDVVNVFVACVERYACARRCALVPPHTPLGSPELLRA